MIDNGTLGSAVLASAQLYALGLALSITIGIACGVVFGWWRALGAVFDPWIAVMCSTPLIASMPLLIAWFGIGFESQAGPAGPKPWTAGMSGSRRSSPPSRGWSASSSSTSASWPWRPTSRRARPACR